MKSNAARPHILADGFSIREKINAQTSFHLMGVTGTVGIALADWPWALPYLIVYTYGILGVVMRHLNCPRCPHLFEHGDCLQLPVRWTRMLVVGRKTTPFSRTERALFYAIFTILPLYPIYWLRIRPVFLILFLVGTVAWYLGQWLRFCRRCRVKDCPFNRAAGPDANRRKLRVLMMVILAMTTIIVIAFTALLLYEPSPAEGLTFSSAGKTMRLSDGRTLAFLDIGDSMGRPVFYFHGAPGSRLEAVLFDELSRQLGIRLIAPDRPGYGLSDFKVDRTYLDWPNDVSELADHLGIERFAVLGWSSGGPYIAAAASGIPKRLTVAAIVAGEAPYARDDLPGEALTGSTFGGSGMNKLFIWSANNSQWLMLSVFRMMRVMIFRDPSGLAENSDNSTMSAKDMRFFARPELVPAFVEAFRQDARGATRDFTIERLDWPFNLEDIHEPTVLVFHGEEDGGVHPAIGEYLCSRMPSCNEATIYPGEGHSVVYFRYEEIIQSMLHAWE